MDPRKILVALADLAPARSELVLDVSRAGQPFAWLEEPERAPAGRVGDRFAGLDALHREERVLRRGLGWVLGSTEIGGVRRRVRVPLVSQPVRVERGLRGRLLPAGDLEITPLLADRGLAARFEEASGLGGPGWLTAPGTKAWISSLAWAAELPVRDVLEPPVRKAPAEHLVAYAVAALYVARDVASTGPRDTLLTWSNRTGLEHTALDAVYRGTDGGTGRDTDAEDVGERVLSPLPLNAAQRTVVARSRRERVVVVSGPPGNGKSHAVVAAALDTVDRGGSVLIATQSRHAAEVLGGLLDRYPGPVPVLFGDAERREEIATKLTAGLGEGVPRSRLAEDARHAAEAAETVARTEREITAALTREALAERLEEWLPLLPALRADVPAVFAPGFDLDRARRLHDEATGEAPGWWRAWRRRRAAARLRELHEDHDRVGTALRAAASVRAAAELAASGGTDLAGRWDALARADDALAAATGTRMRHDATSAARWDAAARRSASALAAALRAGRARRREALAALDATALVRALPLWVGTVTDAEDLLPAVPALFDLVILDEAAHIDQLRAAPVLARARAALVVGDPRQLRFVSFVGDADVAVTLAAHGLGGYADRLDLRRISAFDLAAGATAVTVLDEHYRSVPHLIEFSARRFYDDRIALVTRHPRTEGTDAVEVRAVTPETEIEAVVAEVRALAGETSVGVITPFRAHADALEAALLAAFGVDEIEAMGLRVGTVHAFQGAEAEVVVASLALSDADPASRHRFAADPNLFNVLITRARRRLVVVTAQRNASGLIGDFLRYAAEPPRPAHAPPDAAKGWAARLGRELAESGVPVRADYPVGRWSVDLCADEAGLICRVHPDGPAAHIERQRTLRRAGWRLHDAFPTRWDGDAARAALDLATPAARHP
ncbi:MULTISPECIES: AAA domain-containing protein [Catenuloplanes]|uniref:Superfamily I DNA/RNA helicase n=1 Tax=Catenuloplanes niger TaxID=587534 RepID=A0AAE4CSL3_9ACTN|nr:AAA domain-containing protein [Catenuloplanes niger]MDR7321433.1 superfamily I DNA/RNA helicase [Catenuloplanes niger]